MRELRGASLQPTAKAGAQVFLHLQTQLIRSQHLLYPGDDFFLWVFLVVQEKGEGITSRVFLRKNSGQKVLSVFKRNVGSSRIEKVFADMRWQGAERICNLVEDGQVGIIFEFPLHRLLKKEVIARIIHTADELYIIEDPAFGDVVGDGIGGSFIKNIDRIRVVLEILNESFWVRLQPLINMGMNLVEECNFFDGVLGEIARVGAFTNFYLT